MPGERSEKSYRGSSVNERERKAERVRESARPKKSGGPPSVQRKTKRGAARKKESALVWSAMANAKRRNFKSGSEARRTAPAVLSVEPPPSSPRRGVPTRPIPACLIPTLRRR
ncbi:unnamed protein product, partial [Nesidiocoris tenuis]